MIVFRFPYDSTPYHLASLTFCQLLDGKFDIATESFRKPHKFKFLGFFSSVAVG
ncbi:hypothetical protein NXV67_19365 [Bacteroides fragilis]|nr:hypothetical protein NXV67_19365 [Bacteroides fragilis]